jgi:hypothetical protein
MPNDAPKTSSANAPRAGHAAGLLVLVGVLVALNTGLVVRWRRYAAQTITLHAGMSHADRERSKMAGASDGNRQKVLAEQLRRRARADGELHLSVVADSGRAELERDGVVLRVMRVRVGARRVAASATDTPLVQAPRGVQVVQRVVNATELWEVPSWVFADRGLGVPEDRRVKGALGRTGILLDGGGVLYALPQQGPLADSTYVLPGAVLLSADDMRALAPNVSVGMTVYFLE